MTTSPRQLAFDIPHRPALGAEDFLVSDSNAEAVALIDRWPNWPVGAAVIAGPPGSGKSHLANVWRLKSGARVVSAYEITETSLPSFVTTEALVVEDIDKGLCSETALFHLLNLVRERRLAVLLTSATRPGDIGLILPDFSSRLKALPCAEIAAPDDALLRFVLVKLFSDRQLSVDPQVIAFMLVRMERSFEAARRLVAVIDGLALAMQRGVTRAVAAQALESLALEGPALEGLALEGLAQERIGNQDK